MTGIPVKVYEVVPPEPPSEAAPTAGRVSDFIARFASHDGTIPSEKLSEGLKEFLSSFGDALKGVPEALSGYHVEEIELSVEISASGDVSLIVGSAHMEGTAGVKLTLKRAPKGASAVTATGPNRAVNDE